MDNFKRRIGKKIKARRLEVGFDTQAALAKAIHVDQSRVARWESGTNLPDTSLRAELCRALKIDDDYLFDGIQEEVLSYRDAVNLLAAYETLVRDNPEKARIVRLNLGLETIGVSHSETAKTQKLRSPRKAKSKS